MVRNFLGTCSRMASALFAIYGVSAEGGSINWFKAKSVIILLRLKMANEEIIRHILNLGTVFTEDQLEGMISCQPTPEERQTIRFQWRYITTWKMRKILSCSLKSWNPSFTFGISAFPTDLWFTDERLYLLWKHF